MSSSSTQKQKQQRRRINNNTQQSRNTNAYFERDEYHQRLLIHNNNNYWGGNHDYHESNNDYYQYPLSSQRIRKGRQIKNNSKPISYYDNTPPRHRLQQQTDKQELKSNKKSDEIKPFNSLTNDEQPIKPLQSVSSSSTNSDISNNRKDLHTKNLAAAANAARQQNPQTNISIIQALMNSLILQQQQQPAQSQSTIQLQYQLTNALLATMIQQRLKEAALQAQAQQIQAALPTLLAAQALVYQQQQGQLPPNVAHPGTKFNNRPLVKFPVIRPPITTNLSRHRLGTNTQQTTYQQVQEIERGISLDEAIHLKNAVDINQNTETEPSE